MSAVFASPVNRDPRAVLVREKYFNLRPQPLEQWLWRQGIAPAAERVFWLHWQEGMRNGDWCSALPLKRVAVLCCLDVSTVTRAYQVLGRLGLVRRQDPGRDPANPFQQATAITEVRVPRELLVELDRHPNRAATKSRLEGPQEKGPCGRSQDSERGGEEQIPAAIPQVAARFAGLSGRQRIQALSLLTSHLSATELGRYHHAMRMHQAGMEFDPDTRLGADQRGQLLQLLGCLASKPAAAPVAPSTAVCHTSAPVRSRRLTVFELARLRREVTQVTGVLDAAEVVRQVAWSIEEGALRRFTSLHALHIALKKIREGRWTRPNRMPPNWLRSVAGSETCQGA